MKIVKKSFVSVNHKQKSIPNISKKEWKFCYNANSFESHVVANCYFAWKIISTRMK